MIYVMFFGAEFHIACSMILFIFVVFRCKDIALLLGGCGSVSGDGMGETRH